MSDSDSDENVIRYGTPLEPYEEDDIPSKRKYQEPADQYAVDAHGRRRFHGAFTGGFSAGFGNTVGSQEGWMPQTFKSSRMEKAAVSSQRPEDFMDEEDRGEFGIAPRVMQTSQEFSGQKRPRPRAFHDGPIPGEPVLDELLRPVRETAAVRMLQAMGWRPGQGAGARLRGEDKRKAKEQHRVYGCYMPPELRPKEDTDNSSDSEVDYDTLFAPDDYDPYVLSQKSDRFGLGYTALSRHSVLGNLVGGYEKGGEDSRLVMKEKGKKVSIRGQAFGVGAFEADDEDIYATEDMSHYDYTLGPVVDRQSHKPAKLEGVNVLTGFSRASKPLPPLPSHPPPALPRDYTPLAGSARRSRFEPTTAPQRDQGLGRHELTAEARGQLLGEAPPTKTTPTQDDSKTPSNKDELLAKIMNRRLDFISTSETTEIIDIIKPTEPLKVIDMTAKKDSEDFISIKDSGKELVNVFKPFMSNPKKQGRYERYCATGVLEGDGDDRLSEWEREREMVEFEQAAKLYRPLTGIMGDRFTHAAQADDAVNPLAAVAKSAAGGGAATPEQVAAAAKGVYGVMTRTQVAWRPDAMLCRRFNVPEPNVTRLEPKKDEQPNVSYSVFSYMESSVHDKASFSKEQSKFSGSLSQRDHTSINNRTLNQNPQSSDQNRHNTDQNPQSSDQNRQISAQTTDKTNKDPVEKISDQTNPFKRMTVAELFIKESENNKQQGKEVTEAIEKFDKMDLYKSIFLSDSEDETEDKTEENTIKIVDNIDFVEVPKNIVRNTSPPRGIFANINFDEINAWRRTEKGTNDNPGKVENETKPAENPMEETYGPKIPENLKSRLESGENNTNNSDHKADSSVQVIGSSSDDSWVDVREVKAKKLKKKKKHKSKDKKKSKHKKKDR